MSTLFSGHPTLIQGFNTFLPQGYRIDCSIEGDDNTNMITVTTPTGTHTQTSDGIIRRTSRIPGATPVTTPGLGHVPAYFGGPGGSLGPPGGDGGHMGPGLGPFNDPVPPPRTPLPSGLGLPPPHPGNAFSPAHHPIHSPHPTTPGAASFLGGLNPHVIPANAPSPQNQHMTGGVSHPSLSDAKRPVEFNHAINYVNKIKNRFSNDPDTYKQFLEILQTYQKEQRPIQSVYEQVAVLFNGSVDLLDEFKQFLPDTSQAAPGGAFDGPNGGPSGPGGSLFGMFAGDTAPGPPPHADRSTKPEKSKDRRAPPPPVTGFPGAEKATNGIEKGSAPAPKRSKKRGAEKEPPMPPLPPPPQASTSRLPPPPSQHAHHAVPNGPSRSKKPKHTHHKHDAQSPPYHPPGSPSVAGPTDETVFFDRVKKFIDDRTTYNEFLKLLHLFTEEVVDIRTLIDRAASFLGGETSDMMTMFKDVLGWDERTLVDGELGPNGDTVQSNVRGTVAVVPSLDRPKVDLNTCRKYGPSYRKLPKHVSRADVNIGGPDLLDS